MPTSVRSCFEAAGLSIGGPVPYGDSVPERRPGVYVVSHDADPDAGDPSVFYEARICNAAIRQWIDRVPDMRLDDATAPPCPRDVEKPLLEFWFLDEPILYIGATSRAIERRVRQLRKHKLGEVKPHRGGHWLKTLADLDCRFMFWAAVLDGRAPDAVEHEMIALFVRRVTEEVRRTLRDPAHPFPWANLEHPRGARKRHGLSRSTR